MGIKLASAGINAREVIGTVSQGALSVAIDAPSWGVDLASQGTLTVTLSAYNGKPGQNYAPHVAIVTPTVTGFAGEELTTPEWDASVHRLSYAHNCGDIHAGNWRFAERLPIKSRNVMVSRRSVHVYQEPGSYAHTCFVYDQEGNWGSASVLIEVDAFIVTPERTIVVAQSGDFAHAPYCPGINRVQTWAQARARYDALGGGAPRAIYFKRGETWETAGLATFYLSDTMVDAWGLGAKPHFHVLPGTNKAFRQAGTDPTIKIRNLSTNGDWDPIGEKYFTGKMSDYLSNWNSGLLFEGNTAEHSADILIDNCDGRNASWAYIGGSARGGNVVVNECLLTDTKEYMVFGSSSGAGSVSLIGCKYEQNPDAAIGGLPRWFWNNGTDADGQGSSPAGWYPNNGHAGIRMSSVSNMLVYACDFFSRHLWTVQMTDVFGSQAVIRFNTNGDSDNKAEVMNNFFEAYVTASSINNGAGMPPAAFIFKHNIMVRDPTHPMCISLQPMGCTVAANLFIVPNPSETKADLRALVRVGLKPDGTPAGCRNEVYSNSFVILARQALLASDFTPVILSGRAESVEQNNLIYAPNLTVPQVADGPLDMTLMPFEPRWKGIRRSYEFWRDAHILSAAVENGASVVVPYKADRNGTMTSAASFAGTFDKHRVILTSGPISFTGNDDEENAGGDLFPALKIGSVDGLIAVAFEGGGIRITNNTGQTWPSGAYLSAWLHRGSTLMVMDTATATPADSLVEGRLLAGSGATGGAASGLVSLLTLDGLPRRGTGIPGAPAGTPSRGAYEVA